MNIAFNRFKHNDKAESKPSDSFETFAKALSITGKYTKSQMQRQRRRESFRPDAVGAYLDSTNIRERYGHRQMNVYLCFVLFQKKSYQMTFGVSRNTLLITAGLVWLIAGANILRIGIGCWLGTTHYWVYKILEATAVFIVFFAFIFNRLYLKHTRRIRQKKEKNCPFAFFDVKGWIIMTAMMTMGIVIRQRSLLPDIFIAVFYTGLSLALILTSARFVFFWWKNRHAE